MKANNPQAGTVKDQQQGKLKHKVTGNYIYIKNKIKNTSLKGLSFFFFNVVTANFPDTVFFILIKRPAVFLSLINKVNKESLGVFALCSSLERMNKRDGGG